MNRKLRAPSYFSVCPLGCPDSHPSSHPHPHAPTLSSLLMPPLWTDAVRHSDNQEIQTVPGVAQHSRPTQVSLAEWRPTPGSRQS